MKRSLRTISFAYLCITFLLITWLCLNFSIPKRFCIKTPMLTKNKRNTSTLVPIMKIRRINSPDKVFPEEDTVHYFFSKKNLDPIFKLGDGNKEKVKIVVGIPSVKRKGINYLYDTLRTLFRNVYPAKEKDFTVVVFLAELDLEYIKNEGRNIYQLFTRQINNGMLQIISPDPSVYPDFSKLPRTLGDPPERIKWRSKENLDSALLMHYCNGKADYYLMLEDDVISSKGIISAIENFATSQSSPYIYLIVSKWDSKAVLFKMEDIPRWYTYLFNFYYVKPIDWLMFDHVRLLTCYPGMDENSCIKTKKASTPKVSETFFQHIGKVSSLTGVNRNQFDSSFSEHSIAENTHKNPAAQITTSGKSDQSCFELLYEDSGGLTRDCSISAGKEDDEFTITFKSMENVTNILVVSGKTNREEIFDDNSAVVEYLPADPSDQVYHQCAVFDQNGESQCRFKGQPTTKIRIRLLKTQSTSIWLNLIYVETT